MECPGHTAGAEGLESFADHYVNPIRAAIWAGTPLNAHRELLSTSRSLLLTYQTSNIKMFLKIISLDT